MMRLPGLGLLAVLVAACGQGGTGGSAGPTATGAPPGPRAADPRPGQPALPDGLLLAKRPEGTPVGVGAFKKTAKEGQEVLLRARIGGAKAPFVEGYAAMTVADVEGITSCADMDMGAEGCPTPWDYCCTPREELLARTATVRVAGPGGRPVAADFRTLKGVEPLRVILVRGVVGPRPDPGVLVVDATGLFLE